MTARQIADTLVAGKAPQATRKQAIDLQAAILATLQKRNGRMVVSTCIMAVRILRPAFLFSWNFPASSA
jgi:hypothetical protein